MSGTDIWYGGAKCEAMLASSEWNSTDTTSFKGLCTRLRQFKARGLPSMRVLSHEKLRELKRIPRSSENHQEDALAAVECCGEDQAGDPLALIFFFSHRWRRPNWCEGLRKDVPWGSAERKEAQVRDMPVGDPDDAAHDKARALIEFGDWFQTHRMSNPDIAKYFPRSVPYDYNVKVFFWIDWCCTNQDAPGPDMAALPAYVGACKLMLAEWTEEYSGRAWCQVELLMGYGFMSGGDNVLAIAPGFQNRNQGVLSLNTATLPDPSAGALSNPSDMDVIRALKAVAERSTSFTCGRACAHQCSCDRGPFFWVMYNVACCCQWCGIMACQQARTVRAGASTLKLLSPGFSAQYQATQNTMA